MPRLEVRGTPVEFVDKGCGETVLLLHGSASSSAQWRSLVASLSGRYRVLAPDFYGCGGTGGWCRAAFSLAHEAEIAGALLEWAGGDAHLVGHSYGGAVALQIALRHSARIRSLALIEPAAFHLLRDAGSDDAEALAELSAAAKALLSVFHFYSVLEDPTRLRDCRPLGMPALVVRGAASPRPVQHLCARLARALPDARLVTVEGAGHMLPVTHPERVNALVATHLEDAHFSSLLQIRNTPDIAAIPLASNLRGVEKGKADMTYNDYLADPAARQAMELAVRSARARAVQQYLFAPVVRFCGRLTALRGVKLHLDPRAAPPRAA